MLQKTVEGYFADGCGRCDKFQTPACKVHQWTDALVALRELLRASELTETMKWGSPCYTVDGKNVVMLTSFKAHCGLSFFKGSLLDDPDGMLRAPGPNSQAMRLLPFTSVDQVHAARERIVGFICAAIEAERSGAKVEFAKEPEPMPSELEALLEGDAAVRAAFDALTPGRQRSYVLHVSGAKQAKTRASRAERCVPKILAGKGYNER